MTVMIKKTIWILVAVTVLAFALGTTVRGDERNKGSSKAVVPAIAVDVTSLTLTDLETVPIVAVTPDQWDPAITAVIPTRLLPNVVARVSAVDSPGVVRPLQ
jgi:hypothetical protein